MKTRKFPPQLTTPPQVITAADIERTLAELREARRAELERTEAEKPAEVSK